MKWVVLPAVALLLSGCTRSDERKQASNNAMSRPLFSRLGSNETGVRFANRLEEAGDFNVFTFRNFYNGGGVAIGDLNGDGLPEVVFTSSQHGSRVYLNEG